MSRYRFGPVIAGLVLLSMVLSPTESALTKPTGCGSSVGCYSNCDGTCDFVVTWSASGSAVAFTLALTLQAGSQDQWIALGLSSDSKMGSDSVTECAVSGGVAQVYKSYNIDSGKFNERLTNEQDGISGISAGISDGVLTCSYTQTLTSSNARIFDLNSDWTLLLANGMIQNGEKVQHSVAPLPFISSSKVDFQTNSDISGSAVNYMVKIHGSFMMFAWIFCASIGIVIARFFKRVWPNDRLCSEKVWFTCHRGFMVTAFLFCIAAFIIIFVEVKDWSYLEGSTVWQKAHPYLGVVVTFFVVLNPLMALIRPHPDANKRFIFDWAHWFVGTVAHILSVITLIIGVTLAKASVPFYCVWVLVAWAAYQVLVELFLELHECFIAGQGDRYMQDGSLKEPRGSWLKKALLCVHIIIISGFTIACIVIVAIN